MGKKIFLWSGVTLFSLTLALSGCGKKEEPAPPPPAPAPGGPGPGAPGGGAPGGPGTVSPPEGGEKAPGGPGGAPAEKMPEEKKDEGVKTK